MNYYTNAKELKKCIENRVKGQTDAVTAISYAVAMHLQRIEKNSTIKKDNILIIGPTGCGKTETYRVLKEIETTLQVPVFMFGALTYSPTKAWQGTSIENFLRKLWNESEVLAHTLDEVNSIQLNEDIDGYKDQIIDLMEKAIIVIDEFDKIADTGENTKSFSHDYQSTLLQMLEGYKYYLPLKEDGQPTLIEIDTKNMLFILMGAFDGLEEITAKRIQREQHQPIGFSTTTDFKVSDTRPSTDDIVNYGFKRELIGRMTIRAFYHSLSAAELVRIMTDCKDSSYRQYQERFQLWGHKLVISRSGLQEIAKLSLERKTGARGLQNILTELLYKTLFYLTSIKEPMFCLLTANDIKANRPPVIRQNHTTSTTKATYRNTDF